MVALAVLVLAGASIHCKKEAAPSRRPETSVAALASKARTGATEEERESAVVALGRLGRPEAIDVLAERARLDSGFHVRRRAVEALGRIHRARSAEQLGRLWRAPRTPQDRIYDQMIQEAMVRLGDLALPSLRLSLKHASDHVRWKAVEALEQIGNPAVIEDLRQLRRDPSPTVRDAASQAIKALRARK